MPSSSPPFSSHDDAVNTHNSSDDDDEDAAVAMIDDEGEHGRVDDNRRRRIFRSNDDDDDDDEDTVLSRIGHIRWRDPSRLLVRRAPSHADHQAAEYLAGIRSRSRRPLVVPLLVIGRDCHYQSSNIVIIFVQRRPTKIVIN
jgi:hypothetical protein